MQAEDPKPPILLPFPHFPEQSCRQALPPVRSTYDELGDPADEAAFVQPAAGENMSDELVVDCGADAGVVDGGSLGEALLSQICAAHAHATAFFCKRPHVRFGERAPNAIAGGEEVSSCCKDDRGYLVLGELFKGDCSHERERCEVSERKFVLWMESPDILLSASTISY